MIQATHPLPKPDPIALAHSQRLLQCIQQRIQQSPKQSISFHDYMAMALYEPQLGYYVAGAHKIGARGDFVTAPEITPLFSACLATQCLAILKTLPQSSILEIGAGSGMMAAQLLQQLDKQGYLPQCYWILELSPELQQRQYQTLQQYSPQYLSRVRWLNALPQPHTFSGIILANEVLDAMPVEWFCWQQQTFWQYQVGLDAQNALQLHLQVAPPTLAETLATLDIPAIEGYCSEWNPKINAWIASLAGCLACGVIFLIDYGYTQAEYYHPERHRGTLLCHYQHRVHEAVLLWPGLQDITASVNFTAVAHAAQTAQLTLAGYTTQANFLINSALATHFNQALMEQPQQQYALSQQVQTLTLPTQMGERFKVMALQKTFTTELQGFKLGDQQHHL